MKVGLGSACVGYAGLMAEPLMSGGSSCRAASNAG